LGHTAANRRRPERRMNEKLLHRAWTRLQARHGGI
jgi:hypothetical protein